MDKKIFISYSHADTIFATAIARYLQRRHYSVWIDIEKIKTGNDWSQDIDKAIRQADYVFCILSADSVRRKEVIREACIGYAQNPQKMLFITIGQIHESWFLNRDSRSVQLLILHLKTYQHIEFNGRGDVTEERMRQIDEFLVRGHSGDNKPISSSKQEDSYIAVNGMPQDIMDSENGRHFYKIHPYDLSVATGYPFALDNQWIPEIIYKHEPYWYEFEKNGFASKDLKSIIQREQENCFVVSLIHMRQLVINKSALLNTVALRNFYMQEKNKTSFVNLLKNGSIVVFLYGDGEISPFVHKLPKYETDKEAITCWNELCASHPVYCIRENWSNTIDQHSIDFVKFCSTIADDIDDNIVLSESFGMDMVKRLQFLSVLKDIAVQGFIRTRMSGTNVYNSMTGLSRSYFYQNFIVREESAYSHKPTLNCLFDKDKPFHVELKRMVDFFYNSLFTNYFNCWPIIPSNLPSNLTFLSQLYLKHYDNNVAVEELEYALTEFMAYQNVLSEFDKLGLEIYLSYWDIKKVESLRQSDSWLDYIYSFENIVRRSNEWQIDFSELNYMLGCFIHMLQSYHIAQENEDIIEPCYSFRIMVGSSVTDMVVSKQWKKYKDVPGTYKTNQNPVQVSFQLGDITDQNCQNTIFYPICIFRGLTTFDQGKDFHDKLAKYLNDNGFTQMI